MPETPPSTDESKSSRSKTPTLSEEQSRSSTPPADLISDEKEWLGEAEVANFTQDPLGSWGANSGFTIAIPDFLQDRLSSLFALLKEKVKQESRQLIKTNESDETLSKKIQDKINVYLHTFKDALCEKIKLKIPTDKDEKSAKDLIAHLDRVTRVAEGAMYSLCSGAGKFSTENLVANYEKMYVYEEGSRPRTHNPEEKNVPVNLLLKASKVQREIKDILEKAADNQFIKGNPLSGVSINCINRIRKAGTEFIKERDSEQLKNLRMQYFEKYKYTWDVKLQELVCDILGIGSKYPGLFESFKKEIQDIGIYKSQQGIELGPELLCKSLLKSFTEFKEKAEKLPPTVINEINVIVKKIRDSESAQGNLQPEVGTGQIRRLGR